ncbi:MAG: hypothetical protein HY929_06375 [Euryarchaeota archaeon]|nr:hypothetical protein [Euryarchaeota archaeon]
MGLEAISDSGPLIHLAQIEKFELLTTFSKIYIPRKVYEEVCVKGKPGETELKKAKNIEILEVLDEDTEKIRDKVGSFRLDEGELHALSLCNKLRKRIFLTDDLDAREAGENLGFKVHGSAGIIARAYREGLINLKETKKALNDLYSISKLFITKAIIEEAIEELEK